MKTAYIVHYGPRVRRRWGGTTSPRAYAHRSPKLYDKYTAEKIAERLEARGIPAHVEPLRYHHATLERSYGVQHMPGGWRPRSIRRKSTRARRSR